MREFKTTRRARERTAGRVPRLSFRESCQLKTLVRLGLLKPCQHTSDTPASTSARVLPSRGRSRGRRPDDTSLFDDHLVDRFSAWSFTAYSSDLSPSWSVGIWRRGRRTQITRRRRPLRTETKQSRGVASKLLRRRRAARAGAHHDSYDQRRDFGGSRGTESRAAPRGAKASRPPARAGGRPRRRRARAQPRARSAPR